MGVIQTHTQTRGEGREQQDVVCFATLSDTHFGHNPERLRRIERFDSRARTAALLEAMAQEQKLDFWVHGGDVVDQGNEANYPVFDRLASDILPRLPRYAVPGNHDVPQVMRNALAIGQVEDWFHDKARMSYSFVRGRHHFLMIDGVDTKDCSRSEVGAESLEWIEAYIRSVPEGHFVWPICHFPVIQPTPKVPLRMVLHDGASLRELFVRYPDKIRFFGHGHLHIQATYAEADSPHLIHSSAPSGSFALDARKGGLGEDRHGIIGYQIIELRPDGSYLAGIKAIDVSRSRLP